MRDWKTKLRQLLGGQTPSGHTRADAGRFLKETVLPAFREIEEEIQKYDGRRARVYVTGHSVTIVIIHRAKEEFYYGIQPRAYPPPRMSPEQSAIPYYRAEVISAQGSIGYDVIGVRYRAVLFGGMMAGLAVVALAIPLDRMTQSFGRPADRDQRAHTAP